MLIKRIFSFLLFCCLTTCSFVNAQEPTPTPQPQKNSYNRLSKLRLELERIRVGNEEKDFQMINTVIKEVELLKRENGIISLERFSLELLQEARIALRTVSTRSVAGFLLRKAKELSPDSPLVTLIAHPISNALGQDTGVNSLTTAFEQALNDPYTLLQLFRHALLSISSSLILGFSIFIGILIYYLSGTIWGSIRSYRNFRYISPFIWRILFASVFVLMGFFGPIPFTIFGVVLVLVYKYSLRWVAWVWCMILFIVAGAGLLDDHVKKLDENPQLLMLLRGDVSALDVQVAMEKFAKTEWLSPYEKYSKGMLLRLTGNLADSNEVFNSIDSPKSIQALSAAQMATNYYLMGDMRRAVEMGKQAVQMGLDEASIYYNLSKYHFELLETQASIEALAKAKQRDDNLVQDLQGIETTYGIQSVKVLGAFKVSASDLFYAASSLQKTKSNNSILQQTYLGYSSLWFYSPYVAAFLGIVIFVLSFFSSPLPWTVRLRDTHGYPLLSYDTKFGSMFLIIIRGIICLMIGFCLVPVIGFPWGVSLIFEYEASIRYLIGTVVCLITFLAYWLLTPSKEQF